MDTRALLLLLILTSSCQPQPKKSSFDNWQPPIPRHNQQSGLLRSDEVYPTKTPALAVMPKLETIKGIEKPAIGLIVVIISEQRLYAFERVGEQPLKTFVVSMAVGGMNNPTTREQENQPHNHTGSFIIDRKDIDHISGQYHCPMPYALHIFQGHWIHATEPKFYHLLGQPASHGCVRLHLADAKWLFTHTPIGCHLVIEE